MATFNLTKNADTGAAFKGTTGNDVYNAAAVSTALLPVQTLNSNDKIDAGDGRDTMNVQLSNVVTAPQKLLNLEVLKFTTAPGIFTIVPTVLDLAGANAVDTLVFNGMSQTLVGPPDVAITNVSTVIKNITIRNDVNLGFGGVGYQVQLTGAATDGAADKLTLNLQRANSGLTITSDSTAATAGYENVAIKSTGGVANNFQLDTGTPAGPLGPQGPERITVSGTQDLNLAGDVLNFGTLSKFQAGTFTGDLNVQFTGTSAAGALVKGGSGMDAIDLNNTGGVVTIKTAAGVDAVTLSGGFTHVGDLTVDLGSGDATIGNESFNTQGNGITGNLLVTGGDEGNSITVDSVTGNVSVKTGAIADIIDIATFGDNVTGNVEVDAGEGDNIVRIGNVATAVGATIAVKAGAGNDQFFFDAGGTTHNFGTGDSLDGGLGADTATFDVDANAGVVAFMPNGAGTIAGIETVRHTGNINAATLAVDMATLGSAHRLELDGSYTALGSVTVTNANFGLDDTIAAQSTIDGTLTVTRALVTAPAFNLEIGAVDNLGGTTIRTLAIGTGSDLVNIESLADASAGANVVTFANAIDAASIVITGDHALSLGGVATDPLVSYGGTAAGQLDGAFTLDASGLNADLVVYTAAASNIIQTIIGSNGAGSDQIWVTESDLTGFPSGARITLGAGAGTDIVGFTDENDISAFYDRFHQVSGFDLDNDKVALSLGGFDDDIQTTAGVAVTAGSALSIRTVVGGEVANLSGSSFNFLKFTAPSLDGAGSSTTLFGAAIGAGALTVTAGADVLGAAYDEATDQALLFIVQNADGTINAADAGNADVIARIDMSYSDFLTKFDDILFTV